MATETEQLKRNAEGQITRLITQLSDLEELREELDDDEYEETKAETLQQLQEFKASVDKMTSGSMTLQDELGAMKLAIQAAISQAFKTPEVIKMFALKQPAQLRERLAHLQREHKLGNVGLTPYTQQAVEILTALKKLKQTLSDEELAFMKKHMSDDLAAFEAVDDDKLAGEQFLATAAKALSSSGAQRR